MEEQDGDQRARFREFVELVSMSLFAALMEYRERLACRCLQVARWLWQACLLFNPYALWRSDDFWAKCMLWYCALRSRLMVDSDERVRLLDWVRTKVTRVRPPNNLTTDWRDGIMMCALLEALAPGSCPRYDLLNPENAVANAEMAIKLIERHLAIKAGTNASEIVDCKPGSERKLMVLLSQLKLASAKCILRKIVVPPIIQSPETNRDPLFQQNQECAAKGMGLVLAVKGRKACFNIFLKSTLQLNIVIEIRGPGNTLCSERITNRSPKRKAPIKANAVSAMGLVDQDHRLSRSNSSVSTIGEADDAEQQTIKIPFEYEVMSGKVSVGYIPVVTGKHRLSIIWQGQHIMGSPYNVIVDESGDSHLDTKSQPSRRLGLQFRRNDCADSINISPPTTPPLTFSPSLRPDTSLPVVSEGHSHVNYFNSLPESGYSSTRTRRVGTVTRRRVLRHIVKVDGKDMVIEDTSPEDLAAAVRALSKKEATFCKTPLRRHYSVDSKFDLVRDHHSSSFSPIGENEADEQKENIEVFDLKKWMKSNGETLDVVPRERTLSAPDSILRNSAVDNQNNSGSLLSRPDSSRRRKVSFEDENSERSMSISSGLNSEDGPASKPAIANEQQTNENFEGDNAGVHSSGMDDPTENQKVEPSTFLKQWWQLTDDVQRRPSLTSKDDQLEETASEQFARPFVIPQIREETAEAFDSPVPEVNVSSNKPPTEEKSPRMVRKVAVTRLEEAQARELYMAHQVDKVTCEVAETVVTKNQESLSSGELKPDLDKSTSSRLVVADDTASPKVVENPLNLPTETQEEVALQTCADFNLIQIHAGRLETQIEPVLNRMMANQLDSVQLISNDSVTKTQATEVCVEQVVTEEFASKTQKQLEELLKRKEMVDQLLEQKAEPNSNLASQSYMDKTQSPLEKESVEVNTNELQDLSQIQVTTSPCEESAFEAENHQMVIQYKENTSLELQSELLSSEKAVERMIDPETDNEDRLEDDFSLSQDEITLVYTETVDDQHHLKHTGHKVTEDTDVDHQNGLVVDTDWQDKENLYFSTKHCVLPHQTESSGNESDEWVVVSENEDRNLTVELSSTPYSASPVETNEDSFPSVENLRSKYEEMTTSSRENEQSPKRIDFPGGISRSSPLRSASFKGSLDECPSPPEPLMPFRSQSQGSLAGASEKSTFTKTKEFWEKNHVYTSSPDVSPRDSKPKSEVQTPVVESGGTVRDKARFWNSMSDSPQRSNSISRSESAKPVVENTSVPKRNRDQPDGSATDIAATYSNVFNVQRVKSERPAEPTTAALRLVSPSSTGTVDSGVCLQDSWRREKRARSKSVPSGPAELQQTTLSFRSRGSIATPFTLVYRQNPLFSLDSSHGHPSSFFDESSVTDTSGTELTDDRGFIDDEIPDYASILMDKYVSFTGLLENDRCLSRRELLGLDFRAECELNQSLAFHEPFLKNDASAFLPRASLCRAYGAGVYYGQVGTRNHFQVGTRGAGKGCLTVSVQGPGQHDVNEVVVAYSGDHIYEIMYDVAEPGYYVISVKWSEWNIPESPFICKVTF